ncbi:MAG TPA: FHA domain-containing serine/threonine-protein kinase, partial [Planctomycetota bacterium]|nr:FHA domain-containing serine/threonine-protein kinase [Planctomycetota bacterium]
MSEQRLALELESGGRVELPRAGVLTIGSGRADLVLEGVGVGAAHCVIGRVKGGGWAVKDLGTPQGTRVDGRSVEGAKLEAGQVLTLGSVRLRVVDPAAPVAPPPSPTASARDAAAAAALGDLAGYRIERALGRGGMGQVFLAEQTSLGRKVALKVLAERFSNDRDFVARFQAEARAAAALNHPNIVTVHDVWEERGRHFLAMEYMSGGTLEDRVARDGPLSAAEAVAVLSDAAKGLVYAELRGIVHRDIKPANLMRDEVGTTKIADLGLATQLEAEASDVAGGAKIFGTPHFIAPEQARGERVDGRADLYALGATAYRLLSGRTPFEGATTREILRGHLFETPRPLAEFVPGVPPALSQLVSRLLAKKPEERFAGAGTLLTELERLKLELVHGVSAGGGA